MKQRFVFYPFVLLISALVVLSAGAAAGEGTGSMWEMQLKASTPAYGNGSDLFIGAAPGSTDLFDSGIDFPLGSFPTNRAVVFSHQPSFQGAGGTQYYSSDYMGELTGDSEKTWTLYAFTGTTFVSSVMRLSFHVSEGTEPPSMINGTAYHYIVVVDRDPTGTYEPGTMWVYPAGMSGSPIFFLDFFNVTTSTIKTNSAATAVSSHGVRLLITAATVTPDNTISGYVTLNGVGLAGVTMTLSTGGTATTSGDGHYSLGIPDDWSGSVMPSRLGYVFDPPQRTYTSISESELDQNYAATASTVLISGTIRKQDSTALSGVVLTASVGGFSATTDANGSYSIEVPEGWSGSVAPSKQGYEFEPSLRNYTSVSSNMSGEDYTAASTEVTISGNIFKQDSSAFPGVTVVASSGATTTTDANGNYSLVVPRGWTGQVMPNKSRSTFNPSARSYSNVQSDEAAQDYAGNISPAISGFVYNVGGGAYSSVTVQAYGDPGHSDYSAVTDSNGHYQLEPPFGWSGRVVAIKSPNVFTPEERTYINLADEWTGQNFNMNPWPVISGRVHTVDDLTISERDYTVTVSPGDTWVNYHTSYSAQVRPGWSGTITVSKNNAGIVFQQNVRSYTNVTTNLTDQDYLIGRFLGYGSSLLDVTDAAVAWADYNNDGKLDWAVSGQAGAGLAARVFRTYYSESGSADGYWFTDIDAGLEGMRNASLAWGDYNNDGNLDICVGGQIYRNNGDDSFTSISTSPAASEYAGVAWGDYDGDGRQDLAFGCSIYRNEGDGVFRDINAGLHEAEWSSVAWADYDRDGVLDLAVQGYTTGSPENAIRIYRNNGDGSFTMAFSLPAAYTRTIAWGDYDNDGYPDLATCDTNIRLFHNDAGAGFTRLTGWLQGQGVREGSVCWGDYDNDGRLDLLVSGVSATSSNRVTTVFHNEGGGTFRDQGLALFGAGNGQSAFGDYGNNGRLDALIAGYNNTYGAITRVSRNEWFTSNTGPTAPRALSASPGATGGAVFSWSAGSDTETPVAGLYYNLRIGSTPGGDDILSGMSSSTGYRRLPSFGNVGQGLSWKMPNLPAGTYYWSVQTVDTGYVGSPWASEQVFTVDLDTHRPSFLQ